MALGRGSERRASRGVRERARLTGPAPHPGDPRPGCPPNPSGTWTCSVWSRNLFSPTGREHVSNSMLNVHPKVACFGIRCIFLISRDRDNLMLSSGCQWDCGGPQFLPSTHAQGNKPSAICRGSPGLREGFGLTSATPGKPSPVSPTNPWSPRVPARQPLSPGTHTTGGAGSKAAEHVAGRRSRQGKGVR